MIADRCPGLLRPHPAEDGSVVRLRLPGGQTTADTLSALSGLATTYGNPELQLTSRAGLQLRGLADPVPAPLVEAVVALGLIPSAPHERVRNIIASPSTGISGGRADLRGLVHDLDRALIGEPALAELPGRFLFVLDDGRGDVVTRPFDLGYRAVDARHGYVLVGGAELGFPVGAAQAVDHLIALALDVQRARRTSGAWHVRDLPEWMAGLDELGPVAPVPSQPGPSERGPALGTADGAASVAVPLGLLTAAQVQAVARVAVGPVVITPWRGLVVPGAAAGLGVLTDAGLVADPDSPWSLLSACVGGPFCARAAGSTRELALELVAGEQIHRRTHLSGCERRCGAPTTAHDEVLVGAASGVAR